MIRIHYDPRAMDRAVPDGNVNQFVDEIIEAYGGGNRELVVSTFHVVNEFRVRVAEGTFDHTQIEIRYKNEIMKVNKYGRLDPWPYEMGNDEGERCGRILRAAMNRRKHDEKEKRASD